MPESLTLADGTEVELDAAEREFAKAMAAPEPGPAEPADYPAPRKRKDPDFPFGKNDDGSPKTPFGIGANGKPRQNVPGPGRGGKKAKGAEKPRTQPAGKTGTPSLPAADYTKPLVEFTDGLWMVMAGSPVPWPKMQDFKLRLRAQAALLRENQPGIVNALNSGAQHNERVRSVVESVTGGSASWVLPAMFMITPFVAQSAALWRGDVTDDVRTVAKQTEDDWKDFSEEQIKALAAERESIEAVMRTDAA